MKSKGKSKGKKSAAALLAVALCLAAAALAEPAQSPEIVREDAAQALETYEFPLMGMNASFSTELFERMERGEIALLADEVGTDDGSALRYGLLSWDTVTGDLLADDDPSGKLECFGALGVYQSDLVDRLDELTGCDVHEKLDERDGGAYQYYLSIRSTADAALIEALRQTQIALAEMEPFPQEAESELPGGAFTGTSLGEFATQDVNGQAYTQEMFGDYELTMVNLFTTWCSPCVAEIPDLEKLHQAMAGEGVNVVGVVLDALDADGTVQQDALEKARLLAERTGATYPFLLPDPGYMNGRLAAVDAFPETFFVDRYGNIVGETYSGSNSLEGWTEIVEAELANLREGA